MTGRFGSGSDDLLLQLVIFTHAIWENVAAILALTSIVVGPERCVSAAYRCKELGFAQRQSWRRDSLADSFKRPKGKCLGERRACVSLVVAAPCMM